MATENTTLNAPESHHPKFNLWYLLTISGSLKVAAIVLSFMYMIASLFDTDYSDPFRKLAIFTPLPSLICSASLLFVYSFRLHEKFVNIPWLVIEMVLYAIFAILFLITAIDSAVLAVPNYATTKSYFVACIIGFCAFVCYGMDTMIKVISWKKKRLGDNDEETETSKQPVFENHGNPFET